MRSQISSLSSEIVNRPTLLIENGGFATNFNIRKMGNIVIACINFHLPAGTYTSNMQIMEGFPRPLTNISISTSTNSNSKVAQRFLLRTSGTLCTDDAYTDNNITYFSATVAYFVG